jgi:hypothetical protein
VKGVGLIWEGIRFGIRYRRVGLQVEVDAGNQNKNKARIWRCSFYRFNYAGLLKCVSRRCSERTDNSSKHSVFGSKQRTR